MMKNSFLDELRLNLENNNIENIEDIINEYEDFFNIGYEAGLTDEEILVKLGSIDDIVNKYINVESFEIVNSYNVYIHSVVIDKVNFIRSTNPGLDYAIDTNLEELPIEVTLCNNTLTVKDILKENYKGRVELDIIIGTDVTFDNIKVELISGTITGDSISSKNITLKTISGHLLVNNITCYDLNCSVISGRIDFKILEVYNMLYVNNVSGDIRITTITCNNGKVSSVSGKITILDYDTNNIKVSSVTGEIAGLYNTVKNTLRKTFGKFNK